jgi:hypothetical protein
MKAYFNRSLAKQKKGDIAGAKIDFEIAEKLRLARR